MKTIKWAIKIMFFAGIISLNINCKSVFDALYVNAGVNLANQSLENSYSPEEENLITLPNKNQNKLVKSAKVLSSSSSSNPFGGEAQIAIPGFYFAVGGNVPLSSKISASTGLGFATKGSKTNINDITSNKTRLSYIDAPIQVHYRIKPRFILDGGIQPSFLLGADLEREVNEESLSRNVIDNYKRFDLAAILGVGFDINKKLNVRLGYDFGVINIDQLDSSRNVKNRTISLGLKYTLIKR